MGKSASFIFQATLVLFYASLKNEKNIRSHSILRLVLYLRVREKGSVNRAKVYMLCLQQQLLYLLLLHTQIIIKSNSFAPNLDYDIVPHA